nr:aldose 1-epimerase [uncultured Arsenicibacter sp.]
MAFSITQQPFGAYTEYVIQYTETGEGLIVVPGHGGVIRKLVLKKSGSAPTPDQPDGLVSLLRVADNPEALRADEAYSSALLFPFPSRIKYGIYRFDGEAYTLPFNDYGRDNSIHGLVHPKPFELVGQTISEQAASLTLAFIYTGEVNGYPFPFRLEMTYTLALAEGDNLVLSLDFRATNTGITRAPMAFGWHPYFTLNNEPVDGMSIVLPTDTSITLDEDLLPVGRKPFPYSGPLSLHEKSLDNAFLVLPEQTGAETVLHAPAINTSLHVWQDSSLPYLVVYTPDRRDSIAIEPLSANVNAFNNGEGLQVLEPGQSMAGHIKVWLS